MGELVSTVDELRSQRAALLDRQAQLTKRLDMALLDKQIALAASMRPKVDRDGDGLTELEYVVTMAVELGMLNWEEMKPFVNRFRQLDIDGSGRLGHTDLQQAAAMSPKKLKEARSIMQGRPISITPTLSEPAHPGP